MTGSMSRRDVARMISAAVLALAMLPLHWTDVAAAGTSASCFHTWIDSITPGVTATPQRSSFTSGGERWAITCQGMVRGRQVTGPGTFGEEGVLEGSCSSGSGMVNFSFTIPTTGGDQRFHLRFAFTFGPGIGGSSNDPFPGVFAFSPKTGDCVTAPVTEVNIVRTAVLLGG
jgi:hypothetical protein